MATQNGFMKAPTLATESRLRRHGRVRPLVSEALEKEEALAKAEAVPPGFEFPT